MNASRLQMTSNGSANEVSMTSPSKNVTDSAMPSRDARSSAIATISCGQVDAGNLGTMSSSQEEGRSADAAAHVKHAHSRLQRFTKPATQIVGCRRTAGTDVSFTENHLVSQDAVTAVLTVVVKLRWRGRSRWRCCHGMSQFKSRPIHPDLSKPDAVGDRLP